MEKSNFDDGSKSADTTVTNSQVLIDGYLKSMLHLCRCGDVNCEFPNCKKLRSVVKHTGTCEKKISGGCLICSQFFQLNCLHSHQCEDTNCPIPNCKRLKETLGDRLAERISQRQSQQGQLTNSETEVNTGSTSPVVSDESDQQNRKTMSEKAESPKKWPSAENQYQQNIMQENSKMQKKVPEQVAKDREATNRRKQIPGLQEVLEALLSPSTPDQQNKVLQILKNNPPLMAAFNKKREALEKQRQEQRRAQIQAMVQQQLEQRLQRVQQQQALAQQEQQSQNGVNSSGLMDNSRMQQEQLGGQMPQNSDGAAKQNNPKHALQELMAALRSPGLLEDQNNKCIDILKNNPSLMAAFIRQRQVLDEQRQSQ